MERRSFKGGKLRTCKGGKLRTCSLRFVEFAKEKEEILDNLLKRLFDHSAKKAIIRKEVIRAD
jgi:hypothetical protein